MKKKLLKEALKISLEKLADHPQYSYYPHTSFIVIDNKIIGWGYNSSTVPPIHYGYNKRISDDSPKTHSEIDAYMSVKGLIRNRPFEIINVRLNRIRHAKNSQPCSCCYQLLRELGCTKFYFTTDAGWARMT